jgi:X-X-X-Leu-X-X-Gly heptad repeat protein
MNRRRNVAWLVAIAVGLMLVPATGAMATSKHEKKQNAAIGKASKAAARALNRIAALTTAVGTQTKSLADLQTQGTGLDNRLKVIEAGVPQVLDGLSKLATAAQQLKDGLTTVGAGLTTLGSAYQAVEYGVRASSPATPT